MRLDASSSLRRLLATSAHQHIGPFGLLAAVRNLRTKAREAHEHPPNENRLRRTQSLQEGVMGVSGAVYAIHRL
jgi:hypothetical protein